MVRVLPNWCKEAKKSMIDKDMSTQDLANQIGCTRQFICSIVNGRQISENTANKISEILSINPPTNATTYIYEVNS